MKTIDIIFSQPTDTPAIFVHDTQISYGELAQFSGRLASALQDGDGGPNQVACVFASRSLSAYGGVLATLTAGLGYLPLNPKFPVERIRAMWEGGGSRIMIVGLEALEQATEFLESVTSPILVLVPELEITGHLAEQLSQHNVLGRTEIDQLTELAPQTRAPKETAYLLFTSGSTGKPKGVVVQVSNMESYLSYMESRYAFSSEDRFSQSFDLTFDLSVHDMFLAWRAGACLYVLPEDAVSMPGKFIRDHELTVWFSVPSTLILMNRVRTLRPDVFPSLRLSFFCGEPLPVDIARKWSVSAANSEIHNLYGPTEATIAIAEHRFDPEISPERAVNGITPIGTIFASQHGILMDDAGQVVEGEGQGELWLGGDQVTNGYLNAPEKTQAAFVSQTIGDQNFWYRTGDMVRRDAEGTLHFVGRVDQQVKINGYRVELGEIEATMRDAGELDVALAIPYPTESGSYSAIVGFVIASESTAFDPDKLIEECKQFLPPYMVPTHIWCEEHLPLNSNGKFDRAALASLVPDRLKIR